MVEAVAERSQWRLTLDRLCLIRVWTLEYRFRNLYMSKDAKYMQLYRDSGRFWDDAWSQWSLGETATSRLRDCWIVVECSYLYHQLPWIKKNLLDGGGNIANF